MHRNSGESLENRIILVGAILFGAIVLLGGTWQAGLGVFVVCGLIALPQGEPFHFSPGVAVFLTALVLLVGAVGFAAVRPWWFP